MFEYKVPGKYIWSICPDCPIDDSPTKPEYSEAAARSLAKFNAESEQTHYFSVLNVTRASMQVSRGSSDLVEPLRILLFRILLIFVIQDSDSISCKKKCRSQDIDLLPKFRKASLLTLSSSTTMNSQFSNRKYLIKYSHTFQFIPVIH